MKAIATALPEVLILEPVAFGDARGSFLESYNRRVFNDSVGHDVEFVQDNHSRSARGVLRGLHYQVAPHAQGKLVRVTQGSVFDVAIDMRRSSPRFGRWVGTELSGQNNRQLWIPPGFAHGFLVLSDAADVLYKATDYYSPADERAVRWDDRTVAIEWPGLVGPPILSAKDRAAPDFLDAASFD